LLGRKGVEQLVEIMKVLGTPTPEQILTMNPSNTQHDFPKVRLLLFVFVCLCFVFAFVLALTDQQIKPRPWRRVIKNSPPEALDLIDKLLRYLPEERLLAEEACTHPFFEELRDPTARLPSGDPLPPLFDWIPSETFLRDAFDQSPQ
jgi:serine/threonine protein kinase